MVKAKNTVRVVQTLQPKPQQEQLEQFLSRLVNIRNKSTRLQFIERLTAKQCAFIRQVTYNILFNSSLQLSESARRYFRHNITTLRLLGSIRICATEKRSLLKSKHLLLKRMATEALHYLTEE